MPDLARPRFSPLVDRALRFAAEAHKDDTRKDDETLYIVHPVGVLLLLMQAGLDDERLLAAALLHDVVEDTKVTLADLAADFPPGVVEIVAALSEEKQDGQGRERSWEDRKRDHLDHIRGASLAARTVALADKLHNLETAVVDLGSGAFRPDSFNAPPERLVWYYEQMIDATAGNDATLAPLVEACRDALDRFRHALT